METSKYPTVELDPQLPPNPLRTLAYTVVSAIEQRQSLLVDVMDPQAALATILVPALLHISRAGRHVLVVLEDPAALLAFKQTVVPSLEAGLQRKLSARYLDRWEPGRFPVASRRPELVAVTYELLALHLKTVRDTDLEILSMPELVVLDGADRAAEILREHLSFQVGRPDIDELIDSMRRLGASVDSLEAALFFFTRGLAACPTRGHIPDTLIPSFHPGRLATALERAAARFRSPRLLDRARASQCNAIALRLRAVGMDRDAVLSLGSFAQGPVLRSTPIDVAGLLSSALFSHVRSVVALGYGLSCLSDFTLARTELGLTDARCHTVRELPPLCDRLLLVLPADLPNSDSELREAYLEQLHARLSPYASQILHIDRLPLPSQDEPLISLLLRHDSRTVARVCVPVGIRRLRRAIFQRLSAPSSRLVLLVTDRSLITRSYGWMFVLALEPARFSRSLNDIGPFLSESCAADEPQPNLESIHDPT